MIQTNLSPANFSYYVFRPNASTDEMKCRAKSTLSIAARKPKFVGLFERSKSYSKRITAMPVPTNSDTSPRTRPAPVLESQRPYHPSGQKKEDGRMFACRTCTNKQRLCFVLRDQKPYLMPLRPSVRKDEDPAELAYCERQVKEQLRYVGLGGMT